jgi:VCBS repeat-containing protein
MAWPARPATVTLTITPVNDAPLAAADLYTIISGTALVVAAPGVLANDSDVEGQVLTVTLVSGPQHGSLALQADGSFTYLPAPGFSGTDTFTYQASDGQDVSTLVTVTIRVFPQAMPYTIYIPAAMQAYLEQEP